MLFTYGVVDVMPCLIQIAEVKTKYKLSAYSAVLAREPLLLT